MKGLLFAFLYSWPEGWAGLGKDRAGVRRPGQGPRYWTDLNVTESFLWEPHFFHTLNLGFKLRSIHIKGALVSTFLTLLFSYVSVLT